MVNSYFRDQLAYDRERMVIEEYIVAFLNSDGGTLYNGIDFEGIIRGTFLSRKERDSLLLELVKIVSSFRN